MEWLEGQGLLTHENKGDLYYRHIDDHDIFDFLKMSVVIGIMLEQIILNRINAINTDQIILPKLHFCT